MADFVQDSSDLLASVPADVMSQFESGGGDTASDGDAPIEAAAEGDTGADQVFETPEEIGEPALEADAPVVEDKPEPVKATPAADATEELPEGVTRGKDRNGKPGLFLTESRYGTMHGNHKLVQSISDSIGEPATIEALNLRNEAYMGQERLYSDLTSGEPDRQGAVIEHFFDEMTRARESGETGVDAAVPFAQKFYDTVKSKSPDAYAQLRLTAARELFTEVFSTAARGGNKALFLSTQHFVREIANAGNETDPARIRQIAQRAGLPFYTTDEMAGLAQGQDPATVETERLRAENLQLRDQVSGRYVTNQTAQFDQWNNGTRAAVKTAILDDAVKPALASVADAWKAFPDDYKRLVIDPLHRDVTEVLKNNPQLTEQISRLNDQAKRATSAQRRDAIAQQIKQTYTNRAKLIADSKKGDILKFAANWLKERSSQTHERRAAAQDRTVPRGPGSSVPKSIVNGLPAPGSTFSQEESMARLQALIG